MGEQEIIELMEELIRVVFREAIGSTLPKPFPRLPYGCLLYTSDAADDPPRVHLGGRRNLKKKNNTH